MNGVRGPEKSGEKGYVVCVIAIVRSKQRQFQGVHDEEKKEKRRHQVNDDIDDMIAELVQVPEIVVCREADVSDRPAEFPLPGVNTF